MAELTLVAAQSGRVSADAIAAAEKVAFLSDPSSYPFAARTVEVRETHMSWVFLTADRVFKMKKPVRYPFLDFTTLAARTRFVREEIRLNRRLAPEVYRGPVALTLAADGSLVFGGGDGPVVEWLVDMRRLPEALMLDALIARGAPLGGEIARIGCVLVAFYRGLPAERIGARHHLARFEEEQARTAEVLRDPEFAFDGARVAAVLGAQGRALSECRARLAARVADGRVVEGHGDLRPEHVCLVDPPAIIDCLEFDRRLRLVDPFEEIVFLGLECARLGADGVMPQLLAALRDGLGDAPPPEVLAFYWRYRALLRARLALLHLVEPDARTPQKWRPQAWRYVELAEEADLRFPRRGGR